MGICPEVTLLNSWVLCTFATSWPYPNVDLIGPSSRYFGINRNLTVRTVDYRICSFITIDISSDLDASVLAECHIFSLIIQTLPALTILEDDIHIITSMGVGPEVAFLGSRILCTFAAIWPYPNVDIISPISRYDCFDSDAWYWWLISICIRIIPIWEVCSIFTSFTEVRRVWPACILTLYEECSDSITPSRRSDTFNKLHSTWICILNRHDICLKPIPLRIIMEDLACLLFIPKFKTNRADWIASLRFQLIQRWQCGNSKISH